MQGLAKQSGAEEDDGALLRAHAAGDAHAFGRLYDRHDRAVLVFIRRLLGPALAEAADDLCQETWITVSKSAASFDPERARFAAWLFTIARHKTFDHFRRRKVTVLAGPGDAPFEDAVLQIADPILNPLEQVQSRETALKIVAAVDALPLEQRGVFVMFADGGLSLEEIADATGVSVETAKSRLRYARAKLRESLAGERTAADV
jgi:RNA polymerase sigma-70 factor (ECF subfamily)